MKHYYIHDNGGTPFRVSVDKTNLKIFKGNFEEDAGWDYDDKGKEIFSMKTSSYKKLFVGRDNVENFNGNSLLIHVKENKYIFVGMYIYEFSTPDDEIISYFSPVGNNDVPYPFAIGRQNTYLMIEDVYLPNKLLEGYKKDREFYPYDAYYGYDLENKKKNPFKLVSSKIKKRMIQKRDL
jgi:hypothetical protein